MSERCVGVVVEGDTVWIVDANVPDDPDGPIEIVADNKWDLQDGDRPTAFEIISRRCSSYMKEHSIARAFASSHSRAVGLAPSERARYAMSRRMFSKAPAQPRTSPPSSLLASVPFAAFLRRTLTHTLLPCFVVQLLN